MRYALGYRSNLPACMTPKISLELTYYQCHSNPENQSEEMHLIMSLLGNKWWWSIVFWEGTPYFHALIKEGLFSFKQRHKQKAKYERTMDDLIFLPTWRKTNFEKGWLQLNLIQEKEQTNINNPINCMHQLWSAKQNEYNNWISAGVFHLLTVNPTYYDCGLELWIGKDWKIEKGTGTYKM